MQSSVSVETGLCETLQTCSIDRVKWRHSNLWSLYKLMLYGMTSYFAKLTGEDLSRYLNKTESVGLRKA